MRYLYLLLVLTTSFFACKTTAKKLPSGYDFLKLSEGSGQAAKVDDYVFFAAKILGEDGKLLNEIKEGKEMPSLQIPAELPKGKEANPVLEVLVDSKIGDVFSITMPVDSLPNKSPDLVEYKFITYEIYIKDIKNQEEYEVYMTEMQTEMQAKMMELREKFPAVEELVKNTLEDYKKGILEVQKTESGLEYYIVKDGEGEALKEGDAVDAHYHGVLMNGQMFDSSFQRGNSFKFMLGRGGVIKAWDEGFALLKKGSKAFLIAPPSLAYGQEGAGEAIGPNETLMFYVEVENN